MLMSLEFTASMFGPGLGYQYIILLVRKSAEQSFLPAKILSTNEMCVLFLKLNGKHKRRYTRVNVPGNFTWKEEEARCFHFCFLYLQTL